MVLDEEALERMLASGSDAEPKPKAELTDQTDEFEVYERPKGDARQVAAPGAPPPAVEAPPESGTPPAAAAPQHAAPAAPSPEQTTINAERRPEVFRPSHAPAEAPPTASTADPPAAPPTAAPAEPAPTTQAQGGVRVAIVQALFNQELTGPMAERAKAQVNALGGIVAAHATVAGVFDLPLTVQRLARRKDIDCVVAIGVVVKGETDHDQIITQAAATQLARIACETDTPVGLGITGPGMTWAQAEARVGSADHAVQAAMGQVHVQAT